MSTQQENYNRIDAKNFKLFKEHLQQTSLSILADHRSIKVNEKFVIKLTKGSKIINREITESCKILHFSIEWNFEDILATLDELVSSDYPNIFIFIIESKNFGFLKSSFDERLTKREEINEKLLKFGKARPLVLQLTSNDEKVTEFYYKEEISTEFLPIDQQQNFEEIKKFPAFLCSFLHEKFENLSEQIISMLPEIKSSTLILRFLWILNLSDEFFESVILKVAENGTKTEFLASLDASFEDDGRTLSIKVQNNLASVFYKRDDNDTGTIKSSESEISSASSKSQLCSSVLLTATTKKNKEVFDYLITYWTHLIQELPFEHQVKISTTAFETNQFDVLCDLLKIADFPFPEKFDEGFVVDNDLKQVIKERENFDILLKTENFDEISKFIRENENLKIVYNVRNNSALKQSVDSNKLKVYVFLKLRDFHSINPSENFEEADKFAAKQRRKNVQKALSDDQKSINLLCNRSLIHNRKISKERENEYRKKIRKWYEDINKIKSGTEFVNTAAMCENLKIIFDFESSTVENVSLAGSNALGSTYPVSKWIFVGAKLSDKDGNETKKREQQIKGVLAHELCHYVMRLVFENHENPYYKHKEDMKGIYEEIIKVIDQWSTEGPEEPEDECNGIISSVFKLYAREDFGPELIVRVVQILVEFDNDEEKLKYLEEKYKMLFDFWEFQVIPEFKKMNLETRQKVQKLNEYAGLLSKILKTNMKLSILKNFEELVNNKLIILTTNTQKLLFIGIHKYLQEKYGNLLNSQNFFTGPQELCNEQIWSDFKQICAQTNELYIFVDCTKGFPDYLGEIFINKELNFIFVVSNQSQSEELTKIFDEKEMKNAAKTEINYSWSDLTQESQRLLLQTKINFQNNSQSSLMDLLNDEIAGQDGEIPKKLNEIIDYQLLNLLIEKQEIRVNTRLKNERDEKYFHFIFQSRQFIRKVRHKKFTQDGLLQDVRGKKHVLISDIAGNGKSWVMKNITNIIREHNPTRWVTYVDLKQFIKEFKTHSEQTDFSNFMTLKILKPEQKFEEKIFQRLYRNGKVFILFDGFDEIAPNCAEFVSNLAKSFKFNKGNQLWIATRDYFEVDLRQKLKLDTTYSLDEFTVEDGVTLVARSWVLNELEDQSEIKSSEDFIDFIRNSPNFENYQQTARQIIDKFAMTENRLVGLPQLFKMIADGFKDFKEPAGDLKVSKIYAKFAQSLYNRWSYEKGQIRKEGNIKSQEYELNFWKFHQFSAVQSLFPEYVDLLFPGYDGSEWPEEEIVACGLMSKKDGKFYFLHETFREFFVTDFVVKVLKKSSTVNIYGKKEERSYILNLLVKIVTVKKFGVIRMFLNDAIEHKSNLETILPEMQKYIEKFYKMESFADFFTQNLENMIDFIITVVKTGNYKKIRKILIESVRDIGRNTKDPMMFSKFQDLIFEFLKTDDLKDLLISQKFLTISKFAEFNFRIFKEFITLTEAKTDAEFVSKALTSNKSVLKNIFYSLSMSSNLNPHELKNCLEIIEKYLTSNEIFELMKNVNKDKQNILHACVRAKKKENLKILWTKIEHFFNNRNLPQNFEEFAKQKDLNELSILIYVVSNDDIEFHYTLWELLLKTFENREELKDFILQADKDGNNFIHYLIQENRNIKIIEWTFATIKNNLNDLQTQKIMRSKGEDKMSLLQIAVYWSRDLQIQQFLWKNLQEICQSDEQFLEILIKVDSYGENILNCATEHLTSETLEFMMNELQKIASRDEIRTMLSSLCEHDQNFLQSAVKCNKSSAFHQALWKTFRKYFDSSEILKFMKHEEASGNNLILNAIDSNTKCIIEQTWNEIESLLSHDEQEIFHGLIGSKTDPEFSKKALKVLCYHRSVLYQLLYQPNLCSIKFHKYLKIIQTFYSVKKMSKSMQNCNNNGETIFQVCIRTGNNQNLKFFWINIERFFAAENSSHNFKEIVRKKDSTGFNILDCAASCKLAKIHETLWELLLETFKNKDELSDFVLKSKYVNFLLYFSEDSALIEWTLKMFEKIFSKPQFLEILKSQDKYKMNLLQAAAYDSKGLKIHQYLWSTFQYYFNNKELFNILNEVNRHGDDIFHIAIEYSSVEVFEFILCELKKIATHNEIRRILLCLGKYDQSLLQSALLWNKSLKLHKFVWKTLRNYFIPSEILRLINHIDKYGNNLLSNAVDYNTREVAELTWNEVKSFMNEQQQIDYLTMKGFNDFNLFQRYFSRSPFEKDMFNFVESLMQEYKIKL